MALGITSVTFAQVPDHPIITETYNNPPGPNDAPIGRDMTNLHQEYIEIYLPTCAQLSVGLNCDALNLTIYEVEGDTSSSGYQRVNYRFDLPTFDLDATNGLTVGAVARPVNGVVVLGWVDYVGNPPTDLAGTPSTRLALINGGVTATTDFLFIAINGHHFTGTTNFPTLVAESLIDLPAEARSGVIQNGSGAYLLVNRDAAGYVELCDDKHTADCTAGDAPQLQDDVFGLSTTAHLDGFAVNDHARFDIQLQPYVIPTGKNIDLEDVLPAGGAFTTLLPQIPETDGTQPLPGIASGYARLFVDVLKTTETVSILDDSSLTDALNAYRHVRNTGPFFATPGKAALTISDPELSVALPIVQTFDVLVGTSGGPGIVSANVGGNFGIDISASPGPSSDITVATFGQGASDIGVLGQQLGFPGLVVTPNPTAVHGSIATAEVTITATNTTVGDPAVLAPVQVTTVTATVLNPTTGLDQNGLPLQATIFVAIQGIPARADVTNEFLLTDLGAAAAANLGFSIQAGRGHGAILADPLTDLNDGIFVQIGLVEDFPDSSLPATFINAPAPPVAGKLDLVQTVLQSAETLSGSLIYSNTVNATQTGLRAIRLNHPDVLTFGGTFSPSELIHFVNAKGAVGNPRSGLTSVSTTRTFELAIVDTNVRDNNSIETGKTDDFGIILEVQDVEVGSPMVDGEYIFLSFTGGLQGADIDSVSVPGGPNIATIIFLDLDNLHDVLGIRSIEQIFVIDGSGTDGEINVIEVYSLNPVVVPECLINADCDDLNPCTSNICDLAGLCQTTTLADGTSCDDGLFCNGTDTCQIGVCTIGTPPCDGGCDQCDDVLDTCSHCVFDLDFDATGVIGTGDFGIFSGCFGKSYLPADPDYATCLDSNFDGIVDGITFEYVIGTGDFGVFSGCFAQDCATCGTCFP